MAQAHRRATPRPTVAAGRPALRGLGRRTALAGLPLLLGVGVLAGIGWGSVSLSPEQILAALGGESTDGVARQIVWNLRLPRVLVGLLVGLNLAVAGALLQAIMRNPLASPTIVGVNAGAGLAATIVLVVTPSLVQWLPLAAFAGALGAAAFVYAVSWQPGQGTSPVRMVLAGVAITSMLGAFQTFLMVTFSSRVQSVVLWMSGSLIGRSWADLQMIWPYSLVGLLAAILLIRPLNVLQLGDEAARGLGVRTEGIRLLAMGAAALLAAAAVSVAGLVGFVGLVVPHIMRLWGGHHHAYLIPAAALGGATLVVWADVGARLAVAPAELPVGVLTALIGGPYFVFLLYRTKMLR